MSKSLDAQYKLLLAEEKRFAERVVYYMRAQVPPPWWHFLIPFKFLLEYRARKKDTRQFLEKHLRFKRMALDGAYRAVESGDLEKPRQEMRAELREYWMHEQKIDSRQLYEHLGEMLDVLMDHYHRLFQTGEQEYFPMLRKAYVTRGSYREFLNQIEQVEQAIDRAVVEAMGARWPDPYIQNKQQAIQNLRRQELEDF